MWEAWGAVREAGEQCGKQGKSHLILPEAAHLPGSSQPCSVTRVQNISLFLALYLMAVDDTYVVQLLSGDKTFL